jgi:predicted oxidoreductase
MLCVGVYICVYTCMLRPAGGGGAGVHAYALEQTFVQICVCMNSNQDNL